MGEILVIDDDPKMTIRPLLEQAGHSVVIADDGRAGCTGFQTGRFDFVFLDIFMPAMDGVRTMNPVRQLQPADPIIALSGRPDTARRLPEPFTPAMGLAAVAERVAATKSSPSDRDVASRR
jgi:CheY-like chemotaxis protein